MGFHIRNLFDKTWQEADGWGRESLCKVTGLPGNKEFIAHSKILRPECNVKDGCSVVVFFYKHLHNDSVSSRLLLTQFAIHPFCYQSIYILYSLTLMSSK